MRRVQGWHAFVGFAAFIASAGCGGEPPLVDTGTKPAGEAGNSTIQKAVEYKAEGLSTGYSSEGGNNATEAAK